MNKLLADGIGTLNGILAVAIVLVLALSGAAAGGALGFILGAISGALVAVLVCGGLALLIAIRDELTAIRRATPGATVATSHGATPTTQASATRSR
jgi:hypothetical protein